MIDEKNYLTEAFRSLDSLDESEDTFTIDDDGIESLKNFIENDDSDDTVKIIDDEAEDEEDLEDSYVGKVIIDCCVCHSMIYKNPDEITIEEEGDIANIDEECPYCHSTGDGYKVIGKVAPYTEETETEVDVKEKDEDDDLNIDVEEKEEKKDDDDDKEKDESLKRKPSRAARIVRESLRKRNSRRARLSKNESVRKPRRKISNKRLASVIESANARKESKYRKLAENKRMFLGKKMNESKKRISESADKYRGCEEVDFIYNGNYSDPELSYDGYTFNYWDIEEALWDMFLEETGHTDRESGVPEVEAEFDEFVQDRAPSYLDEVIDGGYFLESCGKKSPKRGKKLLKRGRKVESFDDVQITTDTEKITIKSEPKDDIAPESNDEMIVPVDDELKAEIEGNNEEPIDELPPEEDLGDAEEVEIEDFDEDNFDELGEAFLKKTYDNVKSYKTTSVKNKNGKMVVEGVVKFNSGKQKNTSFTFSSDKKTAIGRYKLVGENAQLCRGKKSFRMTGSISDKKFIPESLGYNFVSDGKRVSGTEIIKKKK